MLRAEAKWIGRTLETLNVGTISPLLNVGSATAAFREKDQPWIDSEIFAPLQRRGVTVFHLDMQEGNGIDLRGDLSDPNFVSQLRAGSYSSVLCCNLLEHVPDPAAICAILEDLVPVGGYLIVTVPNRFPYHPDPIDTMFRPDLKDIERLFPGCELVAGNVLDCGTGWDYVERNSGVLLERVWRRLFGAGDHGGVKGSASFLPWLFRHFEQNCTLFRKAKISREEVDVQANE